MSEKEEQFATGEDYRNFLESDIWRDIELVLKGRLEEGQRLLEQESEHVNLLRTQGKLEEIRFLLELPNTMVIACELDASKPVVEEKETDG